MEVSGRILKAALCAAILASSLCAVSAQSTVLPMPDAFVRGSGAITIPGPTASALPTLGTFSIDVTSINGNLVGRFSYKEVKPGGQPGASIVSTELKSLDIQGNKATILANGKFNDTMNACLTLEVTDDPAGDWLRIRADGCLALVIFYNQSGPVKQGDIQVWKKPVGYGFAKGCGAIQIKAAVVPFFGEFLFRGDTRPTGPVGMISYYESNPLSTGPIIRPGIRIWVPKLTSMAVEGNKAKLDGLGLLNGQPAFVTVLAVDSRRLPGPILQPVPLQPDWFSIAAAILPANTTSTTYKAEGPVLRGDIIVGTNSIFPPSVR